MGVALASGTWFTYKKFAYDGSLRISRKNPQQSGLAEVLAQEKEWFWVILPPRYLFLSFLFNFPFHILLHHIPQKQTFSTRRMAGWSCNNHFLFKKKKTTKKHKHIHGLKSKSKQMIFKVMSVWDFHHDTQRDLSNMWLCRSYLRKKLCQTTYILLYMSQ